MKRKQYTIDELSELSGFSRRTIRYYIQEGLLDPPAGRGRGGFYYDSHIHKLSKIRDLQERGLKLSSIAPLLKQNEAADLAITLEAPLPQSREVWINYTLADGIILQIRRDKEEHRHNQINQIVRLAKSILDKGVGSND